MATFFVSSQNGNDSNDGTSVGTAKASISAGIGLLSSAGDIVRIGPGYYPEASTITFSVDGTLENPMQIIGDPEAQFLTSDNPGEVVLACRNADGTTAGLFTKVLDFTNDDHYYVKNLTILAGAPGSTNARCVNTSNSDGIYFENCHFVGGYYIVYGDINNDTTYYNCSFMGGRNGVFAVNCINCISIGGFYPYYRSYLYNCIAIGGFYGINDCYSDGYGSSAADYGAIYNSISIGGYYNYRNPAGNNMISFGASGRGFSYGNHYAIGAYSIYDENSHADAHVQNSGVFPNVNSGSERSTAYALMGDNINVSPDSAEFTVTGVSGSTYIGYPGMARDFAHMFRLRVPEQSGFDLLPTGSTGENFFSTKITGSTNVGNRLEALQAFVSGAGLRFAANALKDTYIPPAERDLIGTPLQGLSTQSGYLDYERVKGGYPGPYFNGKHNLEFGSSFISSSDHAIKLTDYGSYNIGSYAHNSITASVGVKYNAGTPPEIRIVNQSTGHPLVSQAASGTGDQTGAYQHLSVQTTASGHVDIVLHSPHPPQSAATDEIHQGSGAIVYFADLKINEG